jgi:hypothetical protein
VNLLRLLIGLLFVSCVFWHAINPSLSVSIVRVEFHGFREASQVWDQSDSGRLFLRADADEVGIVADAMVGSVSITDVVLPLPGFGVSYPENEIGELYHDFLKKENVILDKEGPDELTRKDRIPGNHSQARESFPRNLDGRRQTARQTVL